MSPELTVPPNLLPADGRFGCGPSKVRPEAVQRLATVGIDLLGTSHRKAPVRNLVRRLQDGLAELFELPDGYEVVLANGGATAFWEMAVFGLARERTQHYVFGEFSSKFAASAAAAPWLGDPVEVRSEPGTRPDLEQIPDGVDLVALTHNETSTGVMMDLERPAGEGLVVVDATSGAGGLPVDLAQVDVYYFSLQKGFASDGGLTVAILSPAALERVAELDASDRYIPSFLSLQTAVDNGRKHQTYNTPAVATLFLAAEQIEWMLSQGGLAWAVDHDRAKAEHLYAWAEARAYATPFVTDPAARSLVVGTIDLDGPDAGVVNEVLRANGVVDTDAYRKLGRNQLRVGMFPAVDLADVEAYTATVDWVVEHLP